MGLAAAPPPPHRAGLCSPPGTSSTPRRRPRSGATRTPSVGSPSRTTRRICPHPPPCPWHWWGRARSPASVSAPQPHPAYPLGPPLAPGLSAGLWLPLGGWVSPRHPPYLVPLAPARCWDVAGGPGARITSASGHPAHHWVSARSAPLLWGCPESKVQPCPVLPGSSTFLEGLGTQAEGLGLAAGDGVAPRGDGFLHGGTSFASG